MSGIILPGRQDLVLPEHAETDLILPDEARTIREAEHASPPSPRRRCPSPLYDPDAKVAFTHCVWIRTVKPGKGRVGPYKCLLCNRPR